MLSAVEHDRAAASEEAAATCAAAVAPDEGCWSDVERPDDATRATAEEHRARAAEHRAAAAALRDAEERACVGIAENDRDMSPFAHRADIASVSVLEEDVPVGRTTMHRRRGARVVFRARPAMTAAWLQRVVDCHLARNAVEGSMGMDYCPLAIPGVRASVEEIRAGFAVDVVADDEAVVDEVIRRAQALVGP